MSGPRVCQTMCGLGTSGVPRAGFRGGEQARRGRQGHAGHGRGRQRPWGSQPSGRPGLSGGDSRRQWQEEEEEGGNSVGGFALSVPGLCDAMGYLPRLTGCEAQWLDLEL